MSAEDSKGSLQARPPRGAPCWIEIMSVDPPKLKEFYAALFPAWKFKPVSKDYPEERVVMYEFEEPKGISGGILKLPEGRTRTEQPMGVGMTVYYFVDSLDETEKKVHELGGSTVLEKMAERQNGWFMNFKDPEGNRFGAFEVNWENCGKGA
ncbi:uncharacterized protein EI97DRAFT_430831 [Westerdykella ornata]|uniref:VOC domain-containing protein n=1 Tax=Westerdykella ornata TaxID=318751 RepID=A0A6A6JT78_WESOR|nr:uncharacterized protein EI97DRAFT_430831 [Westerdykella ornata]KAF2279820.1 hypothetical protein EI97DRAFT_430831 [Westerdykella ornata]